MDKNSEKVALRKAEILKNLGSSLKGEKVEKAEDISFEDFQEEIKKGVKFFSPSDIENFNKSVSIKAMNTPNPEKKQKIKKSADDQLSELVMLNVITSTGRPVPFFKEKIKPSK